jgi:hypothetical protein
MIIRTLRALLVALCLLGVTACGPTDALRAAPASTRLSYWRVETPLIFSERDVPRVAVRANGRAGEMLLDTGFFASLVSPELVADAKLPARPTRLRTVDGAGAVRPLLGIATIDALTITDGASGGPSGHAGRGATATFAVESVVQDIAILRGQNDPLIGALGLAVFRDVLLTLDYPANRLRIERGELPPANGDDILPMKVNDQGQPLVELRLGHRRMWVMMDTGYSSGLGLPNWARSRVPGAQNATPGMPFTYYHGRGTRPIDRARIDDDLHLGWHVIHRPIADIGLSSVPVIGSDYLRHFAITFDQANGRVRFRRSATAAITVPPIVEPGFYVDPATATIIAVVPKSGAALADLRVGDRLVQLEGLPFATYRATPAPRALRPGQVSLIYERKGKQASAVVPITTLVP